MPAQKLTTEYRHQIDEKLADFRRVTAELRDMLHSLEMPDFMDLLGGGLGLSSDEIGLLTYDESDEDDAHLN